uniref:Histone acetyltransferase KAT6A n=2 Tax=Cacopsylla melanoneura TaxID=428564 RepID=A0A8D8UAN0_9HEMI
MMTRAAIWWDTSPKRNTVSRSTMYRVYCQQKYNVSCIMTLPQYQRKGYGRFLIDFSYLLSKKEGQRGTPEKPLSDLGRVSYHAYWKSVMLEYLHTIRNQKLICIDQMCADTGLYHHDVAETLELLGMLRTKRGDASEPCIVINWSTVDAHMKRLEQSKTRIQMDPECLRWTPLVSHIANPYKTLTKESSKPPGGGGGGTVEESGLDTEETTTTTEKEDEGESEEEGGRKGRKNRRGRKRKLSLETSVTEASLSSVVTLGTTEASLSSVQTLGEATPKKLRKDSESKNTTMTSCSDTPQTDPSGTVTPLSSVTDSPGLVQPQVKKRRKFRRKNNTGWDTPKKKKKPVVTAAASAGPELKQQRIDAMLKKMQAKKDLLKADTPVKEKEDESEPMEVVVDEAEPTKPAVKSRRNIDSKIEESNPSTRPRRSRNEKQNVETAVESEEKQDEELQTKKRRSRKPVVTTPLKEEEAHPHVDEPSTPSTPTRPGRKSNKHRDEELEEEVESKTSSVELTPKRRGGRQRKSSARVDETEKETFHNEEVTPTKRASRPRKCNDKVEEEKEESKQEETKHEEPKRDRRRSRKLEETPDPVENVHEIKTPVVNEEVTTPKTRERKGRKSVQNRETEDEHTEEETPSKDSRPGRKRQSKSTEEVIVEKVRAKPGPKPKNRTPKVSQSEHVSDEEKVKEPVESSRRNKSTKCEEEVSTKRKDLVNKLESCKVVIEDIDITLKRRLSSSVDIDADLTDFKEDKKSNKKKRSKDKSDNEDESRDVKNKGRKKSVTNEESKSQSEETKSKRRESIVDKEKTKENKTNVDDDKLRRNSHLEIDDKKEIKLKDDEKCNEEEEKEVLEKKRKRSRTEEQEKEGETIRIDSNVDLNSTKQETKEKESDRIEDKEEAKTRRRKSRVEDLEKESPETNKEASKVETDNEENKNDTNANNSKEHDDDVANENKEEVKTNDKPLEENKAEEPCREEVKEKSQETKPVESEPSTPVKPDEPVKSNLEETKKSEEKTGIIEEKFYNIKTKKLKEIIHSEPKQNKIELCKNNDAYKDNSKPQTVESTPTIQEEKKKEITASPAVDQAKTEDSLKNEEYYGPIHKKKSMANLYSNDQAKNNNEKKEDKPKEKEEKNLSHESTSPTEEKLFKHYDLPIRKASKVVLEDITKTIVDSVHDSMESTSILSNTSSVIKTNNVEYPQKPSEQTTKNSDTPFTSSLEVYSSDKGTECSSSSTSNSNTNSNCNSYSVRKEECTSSTELMDTSITPSQTNVNKPREKEDIEVMKTVSKNITNIPQETNMKHAVPNNDMINYKNKTTESTNSKDDKYSTDALKYKDANKMKNMYHEMLNEHNRTMETNNKVVDSPSKNKQYETSYEPKYEQIDNMSKQSEVPTKQRSDEVNRNKTENEVKYRDYDGRDYEASSKQRDMEKYREAELRYIQKEVDARNRMRDVDYAYKDTMYRNNVPDMRMTPVDVDQYNKNKSNSKRSLDESVNKIKEIERLKKPEVRPSTDDSLYRNISDWNRSREYSLPLDTTRYLPNPNDFTNNWNRNIVTNSRLPENIIESNKILNESWKLDENYQQLASKAQRETERKKAIDESLYRKQSSRSTTSNDHQQDKRRSSNSNMSNNMAGPGPGTQPADSSEKCYSPVIRAEPSSTHKTPSPVQVGDVSSLEDKASPQQLHPQATPHHHQAPPPQLPRPKDPPTKSSSSSSSSSGSKKQAQTPQAPPPAPLTQSMPAPGPDYNMAFYDNEMMKERERYERYYVLEYQSMYEKLKHTTPAHPPSTSDKKKESPSQHHLGSYTPDSTTHYNTCETNNQMDMGSSSVNTNEQNYTDCSSSQAQAQALFSHYHQQFPQLSIPKPNNRTSSNSSKPAHHHTATAHAQSYPSNYMTPSSPYMGVIQHRPNQRLANVNPPSPAANFTIQTALHNMYSRASTPTHVQPNQAQPGGPGCSISKLQQLTNGLDMTPPPPMNLTPSPQPHNDMTPPPPHHYHKLYPSRGSQQVSPPAPSPYSQFNVNGYRVGGQQGAAPGPPGPYFMNQAYPSPHDQQQGPMYPYSYINGNLMNMRR